MRAGRAILTQTWPWELIIRMLHSSTILVKPFLEEKVEFSISLLATVSAMREYWSNASMPRRAGLFFETTSILRIYSGPLSECSKERLKFQETYMLYELT